MSITAVSGDNLVHWLRTQPMGPDCLGLYLGLSPKLAVRVRARVRVKD